ncbi:MULTISPECIES: glycoside hydrolase family 2 TIM barrel-domain containing protein [unclassified Polaribacter]|uniref:glycoside hydrolase family 2 TIM barrel-domain containing protein n=1 Tax=unclassified Polaribacter TaxID=196858 RepID=UPI0011BED0C6|nr:MULTISPECIES: glycoside hydrolase family 2 TIM barrel-domain containing protein [unclassified Polaribacter]TXD51929.1 glycosidase [Polaribacter sp. IC063]TXD59727.1 glycosidase [Polaribacter sp. IC066]
MKNTFLRFLLFLCTASLFAQMTDKVAVVNNEQGMKLTVNGKAFMVNGMNWDYIPIGTNTVNANFWKKSDDIIKAALDSEMSLLQNMGVNTVRQYTGVPAKWIRYMYENYGIYTMLNHSFGRYGLTLEGVWTPVTKYGEARTQKFLLKEVADLVKQYKDTPGILMYLLGNENNYGLFWAGAETEDFPEGQEQIDAVGENRGRPMYKLMNEAAKIMKGIDSSHPVAICNGDVLFIDIIAEECKDIDIYGTNTYRGKSFGDMFQVVKEKLNIPIMFTEFGADAYNAIENQEDQKMQAFYMVENWKEIYANAAGLGKVQNSIGGFTFQFSDGWWKAGFDDRKDADSQQTEATWSGGGYALDIAYPGANNMNEEWFGICAKGPTNSRGLYTLYPRAAYYALKQAHSLNPYGEGINAEFVNDHFSKINLMDAVLRARGDKAAIGGNEKVSLSSLRAEFTTFNTGGSLLTTESLNDPTGQTFPDRTGFDHMASYYIGVQGQASPNMKAEVNFNILGNIAGNPIDDIFYENVGRPITVGSDNGDIILTDNNRLRVYNASFEWNAKNADVRGFYRVGHYHWGDEGDFFGLYPEANYGPNLDIYNGEIMGVEVDGKGALKGLKAAFGPQLWWGANPAILLKYRKELGHYTFTGMFHEDIAKNTDAQTSGFIPMPKTRRVTLAIERKGERFGIQAGAIWGGQPLIGRAYQDVTGSAGNYTVYNDEIKATDNWGGKMKVTYQNGTFNWYAQSAVMGLVANGGFDQTMTFTGWQLKDSGSGNQTNFLTGFTYNTGNFQIAPNFLWQKPLVGAIPNDVGAPGRLRNIVDDPFAVRGNRETTAGELLLTFDPTPGTFMYEWDNDKAEDAKFAMNLGFVFRHLPTTQDAWIGFLANRTSFAFPNSAPAEDLWEVNSRMVSKVNPDLGLIANFYYGTGQARGSDERLIKRFGGDVRMIYNKMKVTGMAKFNDWGPFDYHRDFNLTYPAQLMLDVSTSVGKPDWYVLPDTKIGLRGTWRSLNEFSPRYTPTQTASAFATQPALSPVGFANGSEWEIRTYIHINIGK